MTVPDVSVVMAVYNAGDLLRESLVSICGQRDVDLELIVVDDGSTDLSASVLREYAKADDRVTIIRKTHEGLTRALAVGCQAARAPVIARHDAKDVSDPRRMCMQMEILERRAEVNVVSSWVEYQGPQGERLGRLREGGGLRPNPFLYAEDPDVKFPYHGSTMFRRGDFHTAGGYRKEFYFAQDLDLWLRLAEFGEHYLVPQPLYTARLDEHSISGLYREEQDILTRIALTAAVARRQGLSEAEHLSEAARVVTPDSYVRRRRNISRSLYFLGCLLAKQGNRRAMHYFMRSVRVNPLQIKPWGRLAYGCLYRWPES